jgi:hypothetical protein
MRLFTRFLSEPALLKAAENSAKTAGGKRDDWKMNSGVKMSPNAVAKTGSLVRRRETVASLVFSARPDSFAGDMTGSAGEYDVQP